MHYAGVKIGTRISATLCLAFAASLLALLPGYLAMAHARAFFLANVAPSAMMPGTQAAAVNDWLMIGMVTSVFGSVGVCVVFFGIAMRAERKIARPLRAITCHIGTIGQGDFTPPEALKRRDEIGALSRAVADMAKALGEMQKDASEALAAMAESEARFRDFAEAGAHWLWETDAKGRITYFTGRFESGINADGDALIGQPLGDLFLVRQEDGTTRRLELESRRPIRDLLCAYDGANGGARTALLSGGPRLDSDGVFLGYRGVARDHTGEMASQPADDASDDQHGQPCTEAPASVTVLQPRRHDRADMAGNAAPSALERPDERNEK